MAYLAWVPTLSNRICNYSKSAGEITKSRCWSRSYWSEGKTNFPGITNLILIVTTMNRNKKSSASFESLSAGYKPTYDSDDVNLILARKGWIAILLSLLLLSARSLLLHSRSSSGTLYTSESVRELLLDWRNLSIYNPAARCSWLNFQTPRGCLVCEKFLSNCEGNEAKGESWREVKGEVTLRRGWINVTRTYRWIRGFLYITN